MKIRDFWPSLLRHAAGGMVMMFGFVLVAGLVVFITVYSDCPRVVLYQDPICSVKMSRDAFAFVIPGAILVAFAIMRMGWGIINPSHHHPQEVK